MGTYLVYVFINVLRSHILKDTYMPTFFVHYVYLSTVLTTYLTELFNRIWELNRYLTMYSRKLLYRYDSYYTRSELQFLSVFVETYISSCNGYLCLWTEYLNSCFRNPYLHQYVSFIRVRLIIQFNTYVVTRNVLTFCFEFFVHHLL